MKLRVGRFLKSELSVECWDRGYIILDGRFNSGSSRLSMYAILWSYVPWHLVST